MTKNIEIEQKAIITKKQFQLVSEFYSQVHTITQTNYYFDSDNLDLRSKSSSLRVRIFNDTDTAEQTLKLHKKPTSKIKHELIELTDSISFLEAKKLIASKPAQFEQSVGIYLKQNYPDLNLFNLTYGQTKRYLFEGPEKIEITLDQTTYPDGFIDYELEIENHDTNLISKASEFLTKQFKIDFNKKAQGKIGRSFTHR